MDTLFQTALKFNPFTSMIGIIRTLLALSLFLTLFANDPIQFFAPVKGLVVKDTPLAQLNFFMLLGLENIEYMRWLALGILGLSVVGIYPRLLCIPHAWVSVSFSTAAEIVEGGDQLNALLCLILIPMLLADPRRTHWARLREVTSFQKLTGFFTMGLFRFQVAFVYFEAGVYKTMVREWADGTALYYFMNDPVFGLPMFLRPIFSFVFNHGPVLTLMTWSIIFFEILLAAALFMNRKWWKYLILPALLMHFSIVYIHGLGTFFISMSAALAGYLVPWDRHMHVELKWPHFKQLSLAKHTILGGSGK